MGRIVDSVEDPLNPPRAARPVYSPWLEDPLALLRRTVGREEVLERIRSGVGRLRAGDRPLPLYLFGPRGIGKSHMITIGADEARRALEGTAIRVRVVGEDIPAPADAPALWETLAADDELPAWARWDGAARPVRPVRMVVFVEGWDRLLDSLKATGRKALRALLAEHPAVFIVASGARLTGALTERDEAFFGAFESIPLPALSTEQAGDLVDRVVGPDACLESRWAARREALLTLSGGNPRALLALSEAVASAPGEEVAHRLLEVLDNFTPHYQIRFRDCADQEQRLIDLLSRAPRLLGPTDIAALCGGSSQTWSAVAGRLEDHGILTVTRQDRRAWYSLTEPLFRHWLEYRSAPSGRSRIGWLGRLLERVLGPDELVAVWSQSDDASVQAAAHGAILRRSDARATAWGQAMGGLRLALGADAQVVASPELERALGALLGLRPDGPQAWSLVLVLLGSGHASLAWRVAPALQSVGLHALAALVKASGRPGEPRTILRSLGSHGAEELVAAQAWSEECAGESARALPILLDLAIGWKEKGGRPWVLSPNESLALASIPGLRYRLLRHGRHPSHDPAIALPLLQRVALSPRDPDLGLILWLGMARRARDVAARILSVLAMSDRPTVPWCPWPGRALSLDTESLARVVAAAPGVAPLSWLGALGQASDPAFRLVVDSLGRRPRASLPERVPPGLDLALARLLFERSDRFGQVEVALGQDWQATLLRTRLLVAQIGEAARGPLHPELERVRLALHDQTPA